MRVICALCLFAVLAFSGAVARPLQASDIPKLDLDAGCLVLEPGDLKRCQENGAEYRDSLLGKEVPPEMLTFCTAAARFRGDGYFRLDECINEELGRPNFDVAKKAFGIPTIAGAKSCFARREQIDPGFMESDAKVSPSVQRLLDWCAAQESDAYWHAALSPDRFRFPSFKTCLAKLLAEGDTGKSWGDLVLCIRPEDCPHCGVAMP